jgi:hypothetical protein
MGYHSPKTLPSTPLSPPLLPGFPEGRYLKMILARA